MPTTGTSTAFKEALEHLASVDLIDLCNEAKIECCRATRDLSSCGRFVDHVLASCGHASLCGECRQRCDVCPICRASIPSDGASLRPRLYNKCIEAGLIPKRRDDRFEERKRGGDRAVAEIQRLYSLFDVALENNLVSLLCHYVTDVCMDESAVSSDPVVSFLLDEVVVKDWCKQTFSNTIGRLHKIYCLGVEEMKHQLSLLQKLGVKLSGVASVLEVMVSSIKEAFSGAQHDLHQLLESTLKAKQHLDIMVWCIRHQFLENVQPRFSNYSSWIFQFHENKTAAVKRAWPGISSYTADSSGSKPTLFIEDALSNLGIEENSFGGREDIDIPCLQDDKSSLILQSSIEERNGNHDIAYYPFESLRAATDILFLHGTSDMVVAKHAIFLYYLYDRHWTRPESEWTYLVDDFSSSFGISRCSLLESLVFYLLDDYTERAIEEAAHLLPEIANPETHPKIAQVLLERQCPDLALTVLRCSGRDGFSVCPKSDLDSLQYISLNEAITAVRVRIECGLLTESFMYQRMHCSKLKEIASKRISPMTGSRDSKIDSWAYHVEVLVTEICQLSIRRNFVDRMIELPWSSEEEKFLHKCLFEHARRNPASIFGSILVVFYLQRYRYIEAYQVDCKLQNLEQTFIETADEDTLCRMNSISQMRSGLVEKSLELLPEEQRRQATADDTADGSLSTSQDIRTSFESDFTNGSSISVTTLSPSPSKSPLVLQRSVRPFPSKKSSSPDVPTNFTASTTNARVESGKRAPSSVLQHKLLASIGNTAPRTSPSADGVASSIPFGGVRPSPFLNDYSSKDFGRSDIRRQNQSAAFSLRSDLQSTPQSIPPRNAEHADNSRTPDFRTPIGGHSDMMDVSHGNGFSKSFSDWLKPKDSRNLANRTGRGVFPEDSTMGVLIEESTPTLRSEMRNSHGEDTNMRTAVSRWRSDESDEDEEQRDFDGHMGGGTPFTSRRRRNRLLRR